MKEKKIIDLKKAKQKVNFKKLLRFLRIPVVVFAVAVALFLSARLIGNVAMSNATDSVRQIKTLVSDGNGFPYSLEGENVRKTDTIGERMLIVSDGESLVLDSKAGELFSYQLGNAEPKAISFNGRALVYSNGSNKVILQSKTEQLGSIEEGGAVVTAALSKNGWFATVHSVNAHSVLTVYNSKFEKEFMWECSNERITSVSLSPNGRRVAVSASGVENADIYSRIIVFNTKDSDPLSDTKFSSTLFLRVFFTSSDTVIAAGDNKTVVINKDGTKIDELTYSENSIASLEADEKGNVAVCCSEFGGSKSVITVFKKNGERRYAVTVHGEPSDIDIRSGKLAVALANELVVYNAKGEEKKRVSTSTSSPAEDVMLCSNDIFTVENGMIYKY